MLHSGRGLLWDHPPNAWQSYFLQNGYIVSPDALATYTAIWLRVTIVSHSLKTYISATTRQEDWAPRAAEAPSTQSSVLWPLHPGEPLPHPGHFFHELQGLQPFRIRSEAKLHSPLLLWLHSVCMDLVADCTYHPLLSRRSGHCELAGCHLHGIDDEHASRRAR